MLSAQYLPLTGKTKADFPAVGLGFNEMRLNNEKAWVGDGEWPGYSSRMVVYNPVEPSKESAAFTVMYNYADSAARDYFTQAFADKFISSATAFVDVVDNYMTASVEDTTSMTGGKI
ncbi:hypothetical protein KIPB_009546 [Kipferlia bialata]|uniref:Uncharacterized protein n=1 Tax=Kipferlia bialata TaxID=797122 RepID=A0A9K3D562_9EUKA|nr:hypothetical protein KIPB_009546 [Kipferlia bialata]|eukprot:g9546.t1